MSTIPALSALYDDMITTCRLKHIGNQLCSDRSSGFIFLVLPSIGETWYYCCDPSRGSCSTSINHDEELMRWSLILSAPVWMINTSSSRT